MRVWEALGSYPRESQDRRGVVRVRLEGRRRGEGRIDRLPRPRKEPHPLADESHKSHPRRSHPRERKKRTCDPRSNMGASVSHAAEEEARMPVPMPEDEPDTPSETTKLPQPVKYEDLQREVLSE